MSGSTRRLLLTGAGATLLAGCSEGTWLGENAPPPLPGERKAVLLIDDQISADPRLANLNVTLPPPVRNTDWPQLGGGPTHAPQHLEAAGALVQLVRQRLEPIRAFRVHGRASHLSRLAAMAAAVE